jgi:hypothetical protein
MVGAGKTTLVRRLIESDKAGQIDVLIGRHHTPGHYLPDTQTLVVGPYKPGKATGGMDNVNSTDEAKAAVLAGALGDFQYAVRDFGRYTTPPRNVVFEGVLISTVYQTWADFSRNVKLHMDIGEGITFAFLMTPADECVRRVKQRRAEKGRPEEGFKEKLVTNKHRSIQSVRQKVRAAADLTSVDLPLGQEFEKLMELVNG